jgi:hypothetical protein
LLYGSQLAPGKDPHQSHSKDKSGNCSKNDICVHAVEMLCHLNPRILNKPEKVSNCIKSRLIDGSSQELENLLLVLIWVDDPDKMS